KKNPEPSDFDLVQLQLKNPHNPNDGIPIEALITQHISGASLGSRFLVNKIKMLAEVNGLERADSSKGKIQLLLDSNAKVLGLIWYNNSDNLGLELQYLEGKPPCTKRVVLKSASHIFDPVGFISPLVKHTDPLDWRHCDGKINPADLITRGCDAEELLYSTNWFCGPPFLSLPEEKWPISKLPPSKIIEGQSERRSKIEISLHCATEKNENGREPVLKFENYSSWERLRRLTAWIK
ncbi:integrase catalytic domain-containing protein, partial [Nephila pilipes]